jgi:hypothetical protein
VEKKMKDLLLSVGMGALICASALIAPAQIKQTPGAAAQANSLALRQYQWKMRTEVQRKGETRRVQVAQVRFDSNGQKQTTPISSTPEPDLPKFGLRKAIAEKKVKEFRETVQQLGELARSYGELPPEQMQRFMASASITPEINGGQKLVRAEGRNVLHNGDSMTVWLDPTTRKQKRVEIQTTLEEKPVQIVSEFKDLPDGPSYMATSRITYDNGDIVIITENFDHQKASTQTAVAAESDENWPRKFANERQ